MKQAFNSPELPPDLSDLKKILNRDKIHELVLKSNNNAVKILFINAVETLDVYFTVAWLLSQRLTHIQVDFVSTDPILLKRAAVGHFSIIEVEHYCEERELKPQIPWLHPHGPEQLRVDPDISLKIQFQWQEESEFIPVHKDDYELIIEGHHEVDCDGEYYLARDACYSIITPKI